jgi:hypothetical protein
MLLEAEAINIRSIPLIPINRPLMTISMSGSSGDEGLYHAGGADELPVKAATAVPSHLKLSRNRWRDILMGHEEECSYNFMGEERIGIAGIAG